MVRNPGINWNRLVLSLSLFLLSQNGNAHGEGNWNDFTINNKITAVATEINYLKQVIGDVVLQRRPVNIWPDPELRQVRINLTELQEEIEDLINHFIEEDGYNLRLPSVLRTEPQVGRAMMAEHALELAIELVDHISSFSGPQGFEKELHEDGKGAYMFDLMDSYAETMSVYSELQYAKARVVSMAIAMSNRSLGSDVKYHFGRFLLWLGFDSLGNKLTADRVVLPVSGSGPATTEQSASRPGQQ